MKQGEFSVNKLWSCWVRGAYFDMIYRFYCPSCKETVYGTEGVASGFRFRCLGDDCRWERRYDKPRYNVEDDIILNFVKTNCSLCNSDLFYDSNEDEFRCVFCK